MIVRELGQLMATLKESGTAVLLVERQLAFVLGHADRIYIVSRGQVVHHCCPGGLAQNDETKSRYLEV